MGLAMAAPGKGFAQRPASAARIEPEQAMYQLLISEIAGQRGDHTQALRTLTELAKRTRDARVARRAVEMAFQARDSEFAIDASLLWLELEPDAPLPKQALAGAIGIHGNADTVKANLIKAFGVAGRAPALFMHVNGLMARLNDKAASLAFVQELARTHAKLPEAHYAVAFAHLANDDLPRAAESADRALALRKDWDQGAILKSRILRAQPAPDALDKAADYMAGFVKSHPGSIEARLHYARLLFSQNALLSAREQFRAIARLDPQNAEHAYAIALMSQQIEDWADAETHLKRALELGPKDANAVRYGLGTVAAAQQNQDSAIEWFRQVGTGEYFVNAQLKIANAMVKRDGLAAGRKFLSEAQRADFDDPATRNQLILAEAQLLRDAKLNSEAFDFLSAAVERQPDTPDFLYDRAMVAEKLNRLDAMETDLRRVIELKPEHAHALNALGYTFAERNIRLDEAEQLVKKAIELEPNDAFILDSLGWVHFRRGQLDDALATLKKAYGMRRDAEIAAHLAEVMLAKGQREEAQTLLRSALVEHPQHESLLAVQKKANP
jgi:tetratricopeptide (TPR) repeat protein